MIRIGIVGYGNLGKGAESAILQNPDTTLYGVFSRRNPETVKTLTNANVYKLDDILKHKDNIDVLIICGGSATDLPVQTPELAEHFNVVDSFDTHAKIPEHFENVDIEAKKSGKIAIISIGWDPGMFSLNRLYANCILPSGMDYTFWGKGVSQGQAQQASHECKQKVFGKDLMNNTTIGGSVGFAHAQFAHAFVHPRGYHATQVQGRDKQESQKHVEDTPYG